MRKKKIDKQTWDVYAEEIHLLREAMFNKKLVVFIGAGTSLDAGMPSWYEAIKDIAKKLKISENNLDYMKIPQFYYNARGKKEYVELMRHIFRYKEDLDIQEVHRNIIKLNAHTMLTTNYDCLLEKAATENSEFIQVISQDKDLPYKTAGKELIKLHGDFEHDNFVLKEDDYLHYSSKFKLIEAYVKSLLAANVILFIGYSFSDPDLKQIFTWVKDILEEDFQRAYMLNVTKEFDAYEFEYYKNLGINIIYASKCTNKFVKENASQYTNEFLENILKEKKETEQIDILYRGLKNYLDLNYICTKEMNKVFCKCGIWLQGTEIFSNSDFRATNMLLKTIFSNKKNSDKKDKRIETIREIVSKSAAEKVRIYHTTKEKKKKVEFFTVNKKTDIKIAKLIEEFDFEQLRKTRKENEINLSEANPELYLEQAYISYIIFEYIEAYKYLRSASQLFYRKKNYVKFFISEMNRKYVGQIVVNDYLGRYSAKEQDKVKEEIEGIEIEDLYRRIPVQNVEDKEFLWDLYTFKRYYTLFQNAYLLGKKTEKEANERYGLFIGKPGYEELRENIMDCYKFDIQNYIMLDRYKEDVEIYRLFSNAIIKSACNREYSLQIGTYDVKNVSVKKLEKFDIYIILRYMKQKDLELILSTNCKEYIDISEEARIYLNIISLNISKIQNSQSGYLETYLTLVTYIQLDLALVTKIMKILEEHTEEAFLVPNSGKIIRFIDAADKQGVIKEDIHGDYLENIIEGTIKNIDSESVKKPICQLLSWYLELYQKLKNHTYYSETLMKFVEVEAYVELSHIYPFCDERVCAKIKKTCSRWKWKNNGKQINTYEALALGGLTDISAKIEEDILNNLNEIKKDKVKRYPDPYERAIGVLAVLFINDKIKLKEKVKEKIKKSGVPFFEWLIDTEDYNYEKFEVSWLENITEALLETIAKNENAKKEIRKCVKRAYLNGNRDKDLLKIYFKYFTDEN